MTYQIPKPIEGVEIIAKPSHFEPSNPDLEVVGAFNPGTTTITEGGLERTLLMIRVAEQFREHQPSDPGREIIRLPFFPVENRSDSPFKIKFDEHTLGELVEVKKKHVLLKNGTYRLRHISYPVIRVFDNKGKELRTEKCALSPRYEQGRFGNEDFRITHMQEGEEIEHDGVNYNYIVTYVHPHREWRVSTSFALTNDFRTFMRIAPRLSENPIPIISEKDVTLFPRKIDAENRSGNMEPRYFALVRPSSYHNVSTPAISIASSPSLTDWGTRYRLIGGNGRITGGGPAPIELQSEGIWLVLYHQVEPTPKGNIYRTAMLGLDLNDPRIVRYASKPFIQPNEHDRRDKAYQKNVTYVTGAELRDDRRIVEVYSGEGDESCSKRRFYLDDLMKFLKAS